MLPVPIVPDPLTLNPRTPVTTPPDRAPENETRLVTRYAPFGTTFLSSNCSAAVVPESLGDQLVDRSPFALQLSPFECAVSFCVPSMCACPTAAPVTESIAT